MHGAVSIVVIDDNQGSLELLTATLARADATVHTAITPVEGLELVRKYRPRLVITDLVMPGMSGIEVLQQVVRFDPSIDVILMTAHYTTETAVDAIRKGAADYLQKPVKIALLRERVSALIDSANRRRKAHASPLAEAQEMEFEGLIAKSERMWDLFAIRAALSVCADPRTDRRGKGPGRKRSAPPQWSEGEVRGAQLLRGRRDAV